MGKFNKKEYNKKYYKENKGYFKGYQKEWHKQHEGFYLYIICNDNGQDKEVLYVGMTTNYYNRINKHTNEFVSATKDIFQSGNWTSIKYIDLTDIVKSDMELKMLENTLIDLYEPSHNSVKNIIRDMDKLRELELCSYLHSVLGAWKTYKTNENKE